MADFKLASHKRTLVGKRLKQLRADGMVPGVVYGQGKQALLVQTNAKELEKVFQQAGTNQLVELAVEGDAPVNVLFHEVQHDPMTQRVRHFDLYTVKMDEKIKTEVPIHYTAEAPAVHQLSAILVKNLEAIEVEALPINLPENIEVDLSSLSEIGDAIHVKDLAVPKGVEFLTDPETLVVKTDPPRSEKELAELEEEVAEDAEAEVAAEHGGEAEEKADDKETEATEESEEVAENAEDQSD